MKAGTAVLALVVLVGLLLWPQAWGGWAAYVTIDQGELGPDLQPGDLTVVRHAEAYAAGDLVAVQSTDGPTIFGWVVDQTNETYRIRFRPAGQPVEVGSDYLVGKFWMNLSQLGRNLNRLVARSFGIRLATGP